MAIRSTAGNANQLQSKVVFPSERNSMKANGAVFIFLFVSFLASLSVAQELHFDSDFFTLTPQYEVKMYDEAGNLCAIFVPHMKPKSFLLELNTVHTEDCDGEEGSGDILNGVFKLTNSYKELPGVRDNTVIGNKVVTRYYVETTLPRADKQLCQKQDRWRKGDACLGYAELILESVTLPLPVVKPLPHGVIVQFNNLSEPIGSVFDMNDDYVGDAPSKCKPGRVYNRFFRTCTRSLF